jgi:hypothetical protein
MVEWSDGTKSLVIGSQMFDITSEQVDNTQLYAQYDSYALLKGNVTQKMIVKPHLRSVAAPLSM